MNLDPIGWNMAYLGLTTVVVYSLNRYYTRKVNFDKLKKFLELKERALTAEFEKKKQVLDDASIHIDVDTKRYDQLTHVVQSDLLTLEKRISVFAEVDKRIDSKLDMIRKEEERIRSLSDELAVRIRELGERQEDFRRLTKELKRQDDKLGELDQGTTRLVADLRAEHDKSLTAMNGRLDEALEQVRVEARDRVNAVASMAEQEGNALSHKIEVISEELDQSQAALAASLEAKQAEQAAALKRSQDETRRLLEEQAQAHQDELARLFAESKKSSDELKIQGDAMARELAGAQSRLIQENSDFSERLMGELADKVEAYQQKMLADLRQKESEVADRVKGMEDVLLTAEKHLVSTADAKFEQVQEGLGAFQERLEARLGEVTKTQAEAQRAALDEREAQLASMAERLEQVESTAASVESRVKEAHDLAAVAEQMSQTFERRMLERLAAQEQAWDRFVSEKLSSLERGVHPRLRELEDRAAAAMDAFLAAERKNLELVMKETQAAVKGLTDDLEGRHHQVENELSNLDERFGLLREAFGRAERQLDVDGWVKAASEALADEAAGHRDSVLSVLEQVEERAKTFEAALAADVPGQVSKAQAILENLVPRLEALGQAATQSRAEVEAARADARSLAAEREELVAKLEAGFAEERITLAASVKDEEAKLLGEISRMADMHRKELLMAFENAAGEYRALFTGGRTKAEDRIQNLLSTLEARLDTRITEWESETLGDRRVRLEEASGALLTAFREHLGQAEAEAQAWRRESRAAWEARLEEGQGDVATHIQGIRVELTEKLSAFQQDLEREQANLAEIPARFRAQWEGLDKEEEALRAAERRAHADRMKDALDRFIAETEGEVERVHAVRQGAQAHLDEIRALAAGAQKVLSGRLEEESAEGRRRMESAVGAFLEHAGEKKARVEEAHTAFVAHLADEQKDLEQILGRARDAAGAVEELRVRADADREAHKAMGAEAREAWRSEKKELETELRARHGELLAESTRQFAAETEVERAKLETLRTAAESETERMEALRRQAEGELETLRHAWLANREEMRKEEFSLRAEFRQAEKSRLDEEAGRFAGEIRRKEDELDKSLDQWRRLDGRRKEIEKTIEKWQGVMARGEKTLAETAKRLSQKSGVIEGELLSTREKAKGQIEKALSSFTEEGSKRVAESARLETARVTRRLEDIAKSFEQEGAHARKAFADGLQALQREVDQLKQKVEKTGAEGSREWAKHVEAQQASLRALEQDGRAVASKLLAMPEALRHEIEAVIEGEKASARQQIAGFGQEIRSEAGRRLGESAAGVMAELEREKAELRKSFETLAQYAREDRDIFQNRLLQYRADLEIQGREILDGLKGQAGAGIVHAQPGDVGLPAKALPTREWKAELDRVENEIKNLSVKKDRRFDAFGEQAQQAFDRVEKKLGEFQRRLEETEGRVEKRATKRFLIFLERLKQQAARSQEETARGMAKADELKVEWTSRLAELADFSRDHQARESELLERIAGEAEALKAELHQAGSRFLEEQQARFNEELRGASVRLETLSREEMANRDRRQETLASVLEEQGRKVQSFVREQEGRLEATQKSVDQALADHEAAIHEGLRTQEKRLDGFILEKQRGVDEGLSAMQDRLSAETEDRFRAVNEQIRIILEKMDTFLDQTELFKKVDALQVQLGEDLTAYDRKVTEINKHLEAASAFEEKAAAFRQLEQQVSESTERLTQTKKTLAKTEDQLTYLVKIAEDLKAKGDNLENRRQELLRAEETVARHVAEAGRLNESFKSFLAVKAEIDEVLGDFTGLRTAAQDAKSLQGQLSGQIEASAGLQREVNNRMEDLQEKSATLLAQQRKLMEFKARFDQLDMAIQDMEQRQKAIANLRTELAVEKEELADLKEKVQIEMDEYRALLERGEAEKSTARTVKDARKKEAPDRITESELEDVVAELKHLGWETDRIAEHLKVDERQVKQILGVR